MSLKGDLWDVYCEYCTQNWLCKSRTILHKHDISFVSESCTSCITYTQFTEWNKGMPWSWYLWCHAYSITCTNVTILQSLWSQLAFFSSDHTTFHQTTQQGDSINLTSDVMLWMSGKKRKQKRTYFLLSINTNDSAMKNKKSIRNQSKQQQLVLFSTFHKKTVIWELWMEIWSIVAWLK